MSMRTSVNGRPSGTDGSDFSYRMVVDSRYKKVTQGRSRLYSVILIQAFIQFLAALTLFTRAQKGVTLEKLSVYSTGICFISLIVGEIGRRRSRTNFLKFYLFVSSLAILASVASLVQSDKSIEIIKHFKVGEASVFDVLNVAAILLGLLVQIFAVFVAKTLLHNMAPPKRAL